MKFPFRGVPVGRGGNKVPHGLVKNKVPLGRGGKKSKTAEKTH